jgi:hypothetical protein
VIETPGPLGSDDLERLAGWQRRLRLLLLVGVALVLGWLVAMLAGDPAWQAALATAATAALVTTGVAAQVGLRCPRCRARVLLRAGLTLPDRCARCGVALRARGATGVDPAAEA